jgi:hypothetical protein
MINNYFLFLSHNDIGSQNSCYTVHPSKAVTGNRRRNNEYNSNLYENNKTHIFHQLVDTYEFLGRIQGATTRHSVSQLREVFVESKA